MKTLLCRTSARLAVGLAFTISCVTANAIERYVSLTGGHVPPFLSWDAAATNIQAAVDAAVDGDTIWVTNGVYATGGVVGWLTNRVSVTKRLTLTSVNGPDCTVIQGYQVPGTTNGNQAIRCVYLRSGAVLSGFTLTNGATLLSGDGSMDTMGGGVCCGNCELVTNCVIIGNAAYKGGGACNATLVNCTVTRNRAHTDAGGMYYGFMTNCIVSANSAGGGGGIVWVTAQSSKLVGNEATFGGGGGAVNDDIIGCTIVSNSARYGGGTYDSRLHNCTLVGNVATTTEYYGAGGGGAAGGELNNSIAYFNQSMGYGSNYAKASLRYSCATPLPTGPGNIESTPEFVDYAGGNLRLQSNSPCINKGTNAIVTTSFDLDGRPRIVAGTVDMGAHEFQTNASGAFIGWLAQYSLPTDGSADTLDSDGDGLNNWQESRCLTDPTNALSVLRLLSASPSGTNVTVSWQSVPRLSYFLERSSDLTATPRFTPLATNVTGWTGATTTFMDTNAASGSPLFYRVGVAN